MTQNKRFKAWLVGAMCCGFSVTSFAQADTIQIDRRVMSVKYSVYNVPLDAKYARKVLYREAGSQPSFRQADVMTGAAVGSVGAGVFLLVDALKGIPAVEVGPNGREFPYTIRSQKKFAGGILALLLGGCLSQYALDLKVKAVRKYNGHELERSKVEVGYLSNQRIGFRINLL